MNFYIYESGTFSIPKGVMQHKACVTVCVVISDIKKESLKKKFDSFCSNLPKKMVTNGEPKGSKFDNSKKLEFCETLYEFKDYLLIIPVTIDMTLLAMLDIENNMKEIVSNKCLEFCDYVEHESMKEDLRLLSKQLDNLSNEEFLKIGSYAYAFFKSVQHSIMVLSTKGNENSWNDVVLEIDKINPKKNTREKEIFSKMVGMWTESWSRSDRIILLKEIHTSDHPIVKKFDIEDGLDGRKLTSLTDWSDSKESWGIQIADISSNIVYNAVNDLDNENDSFAPFCELMKLSIYGYYDGPGLFSPFVCNDQYDELFRVKYKKLGEEMIKYGFLEDYNANIIDRLGL